MTTKRTNDDNLLAMIAAHDQLHRDAPRAGLSEADDRASGALWDQITATIPTTPEGVLALLEYSDCEDDPLAKAATSGLRAIVAARAIQEPPLLPPGATALQKMIAVEWRVRSISVKISDRADDFKFWLREQDQSVRELGAGVDLSEVYALYDRINEQANALLDQINETPPITSLADAIALLETGDPPIEAVIAGLRAIAEKGGVA